MTKLRTKIAIVLLLCVLLSGLNTGIGQEVIVTAKLDTNAMLIGDHVGLSLKYTGPAGAQVLWPFIPDTVLDNIIVIGRGKIDTVVAADKKSVSYSQEINLTCYDSGFYTIPSIPFRYRVLPDTASLTAISGMTLLAVHTVKVDTTQAIKPIAGPLKVPLTFREMLPWILGGILLAAIVAAIVWYLKKRKKKEPVFNLKPKVILLPHEAALADIEKLRLKKLWQAGKIKEYHSELTEILRRYIEDRFRVPALEQTSAEILEGLESQQGCSSQSIDKLGKLLILADMVKFAKAQPLAVENERCLSDGIEFVHETTAAAHA
jgi:hypothetical protein